MAVDLMDLIYEPDPEWMNRAVRNFKLLKWRSATRAIIACHRIRQAQKVRQQLRINRALRPSRNLQKWRNVTRTVIAYHRLRQAQKTREKLPAERLRGEVPWSAGSSYSSVKNRAHGLCKPDVMVEEAAQVFHSSSPSRRSEASSPVVPQILKTCDCPRTVQMQTELDLVVKLINKEGELSPWNDLTVNLVDEIASKFCELEAAEHIKLQAMKKNFMDISDRSHAALTKMRFLEEQKKIVARSVNELSSRNPRHEADADAVKLKKKFYQLFSESDRQLSNLAVDHDKFVKECDNIPKDFGSNLFQSWRSSISGLVKSSLGKQRLKYISVEAVIAVVFDENRRYGSIEDQELDTGDGSNAPDSEMVSASAGSAFDPHTEDWTLPVPLDLPPPGLPSPCFLFPSPAHKVIP